VHFNTRITPEVRRRLEIDAKRNGNSLSREIELRLSDSIQRAPKADSSTRALAYLIAQLAKILETAERKDRERPFDWRSNRFDFEAFKYAIVQLLDRLAPAVEIESGRYVLFETPREAGTVAATAVLALLERDEAQSHAMGERREAASGSLYYSFPQAARALKRTEKDK
jgi:hypothetical protein